MISQRRVKELREARGWSQEKLGRMISADGPYINKIEHGQRRDIRATVLCRLADVFGCSTDYLLGRTNETKAA